MGNSLRTPLLVAVTSTALLVPLTATASGGGVRSRRRHRGRGARMAPIGGGYETPSLEGFGRLSAQGASGPTVDLVVVPSAYGDKAKDRAENLGARPGADRPGGRGCDTVVTRALHGVHGHGSPCCSTARTRWTRPTRSASTRRRRHLHPRRRPGAGHEGARRVPGRDGDGSALGAGATIGGTSAGAAVQSRNMINGYVGASARPRDSGGAAR